MELRDSWRIGKAAIQVTRSLGDQDVKADGLTATPEVFTRELTEDDEFLVLACDGLWDTLSNDTVVSIVQVGERAAAVVWPKPDKATQCSPPTPQSYRPSPPNRRLCQVPVGCRHDSLPVLRQVGRALCRTL